MYVLLLNVEFLGAFKDARLGPILVMERMKENLQELARRLLVTRVDSL